jgi:predicted metal-dependent hydrolase
MVQPAGIEPEQPGAWPDRGRVNVQARASIESLVEAVDRKECFGVLLSSCYDWPMHGDGSKPERMPVVRVVRSERRRASVSARLVENGTVIEVLAPASMGDGDLAPIVEKLKGRVLRHAQKRETADDEVLTPRARELNREYFGGKLRWQEIRYVTNQQHRFGSCTPATGTIRISHRVAALPTWVRDYVLLHELAHLAEANHGRRFWKLLERYPKTERARGYLMALGLERDEDEPAEPDLE